MRKKTLLWVIFLMSISLVGLIGFQVYWIHHAVQMEEQVFDRNVNDALHQVARRLETQEAVHFLKEEAPQIRAAALSEEAPAKAEKPKPEKKIVKHVKKEVPASAPVPAPKKVKATEAPAKTAPASFLVTVSPSAAPKQDMHGNTYVRGNHSAVVPTREHFEIFGKGPTDSIVVWKILASQKINFDSIVSKHPIKYFQKPRTDSTYVFRMGNDTLSRARHELLRQVQPRDIKSIKVQGKMIDIFTDSLEGKALRNALAKVDTIFGRQPKRYIPSTKGHTIPSDIIYSTNTPPSPPPPAPAYTRFPQPVVEAHAQKKKNPEQEKQQKAQAKAQRLNQVMQQMAVEYVRKEKPLKERLQELQLEELLGSELLNRNIITPYHFSLQTKESAKNPDIVLASSHSFLPIDLQENEYAVRLFPNDVLTSPSYLLLNFPDRNLYVWQRLLLPSAMSLVFTLIIILTFSVTLYTILRQKKISEIKNDFINNMTHEFKTPIATISLALDALVNPKVRTDEARVNYYANIIKDENKRMHQQVEKVLQTAQMERQRLQLAFEEIDVHQLINKAVEPFRLHIEQRQGKLDLRLEAEKPVLWADPAHLVNMVANLLDNANKYSPSAPHIVIQTASVSRGIHISVEDKGAGMSREAQKRVFEKFYRVPTGNLHNVKGFGLGLSYVKTMAEAHSGTIHLRSELGKGSKFTLWLPSQKQPHYPSHS